VVLSASEFTGVSDEEVDHAMEYSLGMVGDQGKPPVMAAHVMYFVHKGRPEKASEVFAMYRARGIPIQGDFALAEQYLQTGGKG
jgi:hypothetical protein